MRHRKDTLTKKFFLTSTENVMMTRKEKNAHKLDSFTLVGDTTLKLHCPEDGLQNMQLTLFYWVQINETHWWKMSLYYKNWRFFSPSVNVTIILQVDNAEMDKTNTNWSGVNLSHTLTSFEKSHLGRCEKATFYQTLHVTVGKA